MTTCFFAFRDSPQRRRALASPPGSDERYLLFGMDQLAASGHEVRHNLESAGVPVAWARAAGGVTKWTLEHAGGYGGDFATVFASLRTANRADVVFSTVDTVGIPLMLLNRARRLRSPLVYVAIGLPERIARLGSERMQRLYARALGSSAAVVTYSAFEADELRAWLARHGSEPPVSFLPFGVDEVAFSPSLEPPTVDVVSVGADPHRDLELLIAAAGQMRTRSFRIVTTADRARGLRSLPENIEIEPDLSFEAMRRRLQEARVVALPVLENSYSGATTVLLQAMALGKPVVVTRTKAIASGYGLVDGENCRLVAPGDAQGFERVLAEVLQDEAHARALGERARTTVETELSWGRYVDRIEAILDEAAGVPPDARFRPS